MGNEVVMDVRRDENDEDRIEIKRITTSGAFPLDEIFELVLGVAGEVAIPKDEVGLRVRKMANHIKRPNIFFVVSVNRVIRGFIHAEVGDTANTAHVGWLRMEVHPDYRNRKLGSMLMEAVVRAAKKEGLLRLEITSYAPNFKARLFFDRFDFYNEGRHHNARRDPASGKLLDTYTLAKYLNGG